MGKLNRRDIIWLEKLGPFVIFPITLNHAKLNLFQDALSRAPHAIHRVSLNDLGVPFIGFEEFSVSY